MGGGLPPATIKFSAPPIRQVIGICHALADGRHRWGGGAAHQDHSRTGRYPAELKREDPRQRKIFVQLTCN